MKRRSLLGAMLASCAAPAFVKAGVLMPARKVWAPSSGVYLSEGMRAALVDSLKLVDVFSGGVLSIYTGAGPDFGGTLLGTIALGSMGGGLLQGTAMMKNTGRAGKAILTIPGMGEVKCDVGGPGSGAGIVLNNTALCTGMPVEVAARVRMPRP